MTYPDDRFGMRHAFKAVKLPHQGGQSAGISTPVHTNWHTLPPLRLATRCWDNYMAISRKSIASALGSLALALVLNGVAVAQNSTPTSGVDKMGAMHSDMKGMHNKMMGMHMMPATVTAADAKTGMVDVTSEGMALKVHFPPSAMASLKAGDKITLHMGFSKP
ncbi:hypothetical protein [Rhodanobacter sp. OR87]|uniref:hypothetical protein n=1 Tax=Rhodanobacter sp. OR87 TaxID=1076523 RepID=UPI001E469172|nr:hypothetical protein [Rhodanobacter sp. OR87]